MLMEVVEIDWTIIEESRDDHADQGCQPPNSLSIIRQVDQQTPNHAIHQSKDLILELPAKKERKKQYNPKATLQVLRQSLCLLSHSHHHLLFRWKPLNWLILRHQFHVLQWKLISTFNFKEDQRAAKREERWFFERNVLISVLTI